MVIQSFNEEFIGRTKEIDIFTSWLGDADAPILYFHDALKEIGKKGGIGKTWLLNKCVSIVNAHHKNIIPVFVDFFNVEDRDGIAVTTRVVQVLHEWYPNWSATSFQKALNAYYHATLVGDTDIPTLRDQIGNALATDLQELREHLVQNNCYLLLFFDTFELVEENPTTAVLQAHQKFPDTYGLDRIRFVMAGRNELNMSHFNWINRQKEVRDVELLPFNYDETIDLLRIICYAFDIETLSQQALQALYEHCEGRPILIGLVADVLNSIDYKEKLHKLIAYPKEDFEASLVEQIASLYGPDSKRSWAILFMAHIYQRFNPELLDLIMSKPELRQSVPQMAFQDLHRELPKLTFVRHSKSGQDFVLHDEMRRLVNDYCWKTQDPNESIRQVLSDIAIEYYTKKLDEQLQEQNEQARQSFIVEMLFHQLFKNTSKGFEIFEKHFTKAIELWMKAYARSLLQEVHKFEDRLSLEECFRMKLAEARLLRLEENPTAALNLYNKLEADVEQFNVYRIKILYEKGQIYQSLRNFSDAIVSYQTGLEKEELKENEALYADILGELGYIYRLEGNLDSAAHYYNSAITIQRTLDDPPGYANILNNLGMIYRLRGSIEEGLLMCKLGLRIRQELFQEGKLSELYIALSLSTIGQIYLDRYDVALDKKDIVRAEDCFQHAFKIYQLIEYKRGIAATYNRFGQVQMIREDWHGAKDLFEKAYEASVQIDAEVCINSLNKQGRVLASQHKWDEAAAYFRQAIELAHQANDFRQQAESLIDLAETLEQLRQSQHNLLREATQISGKYSYYNLLGRIEDMQGDTYFKAGEYQMSFKHFMVACRYLALFNHQLYEKYVRKLLDLFLDTPTMYLLEAVDALTNYWYDFKLDQDYPELLNLCRSVSKHLVL